ncbi:unnamed protein product [Pieris brassicae]|uniref:Uncharacterized protein n=1 Tax=Pieris brassicae TaxID=7116 RepID=A0A9P0TUE2_PIEBR|nr:unnamed protein product [Pieris brassicae]
MQSGGARRGKANGSHLEIGLFAKHHVSARPLGNSAAKRSGTIHVPRAFFVCATFLSFACHRSVPTLTKDKHSENKPIHSFIRVIGLLLILGH